MNTPLRWAAFFVGVLVLTPGQAGAGQDGDKTASEPVKLEGRGDRATRKFHLEDGLVIWSATHAGSSNFKIHLIDAKGDKVDTWVNEIGKLVATRGENVRRAGDYRIQVEADGPWTVSLEQPRPETASESPQHFHGKGRKVSKFFTLREGSHVFESVHKGTGIFRAQLLDSRGRLVEQVAGVIGSYDGSKAVKITEPGIYLMSVVADGEWTVSIE